MPETIWECWDVGVELLDGSFTIKIMSKDSSPSKWNMPEKIGLEVYPRKNLGMLGSGCWIFGRIMLNQNYVKGKLAQ